MAESSLNGLESTVGKGEIASCFVYCRHIKHGLVWYRLTPFPDDKILDLSKLKQIADNILKCI